MLSHVAGWTPKLSPNEVRMTVHIPPTGSQVRFTSETARSGGFLKIPLNSVEQFGQASQTLAAIIQCCRQDGNNSTFRRIGHLAKISGVSVRTCKDHIAALVDAGAIQNAGRQGRRTNTLRVPDAVKWESGGFVCLPRYALDLTWSERIVYAWIVLRCERSGVAYESVNGLAKVLGLARSTAAAALRSLTAKGWIDRDQPTAGDRSEIRLLAPPNGCTDFCTRPCTDSCPPGVPIPALAESKDKTKEKNHESDDQNGFELGHIDADDLEPNRLPSLHRRLVRAGVLNDSEYDRFRFMAGVAHARRLGENPPAMLAWMARNQTWHFATDGDADVGRRWLKPATLERPSRPSEGQSDRRLGDILGELLAPLGL